MPMGMDMPMRFLKEEPVGKINPNILLLSDVESGRNIDTQKNAESDDYETIHYFEDNTRWNL